MSNPNNCSTCEWKAHDDCGHCYMFFDAPTEVCMQHTGRKAIGFVGVPMRGKGRTASMALLIANMISLPKLDETPRVDPDPDGLHDIECGINIGNNCDCPALAPNRPEW